MGPRATYGSVLNELAKCNEKIVALSADLGNSSGLDRFKKDNPDRFIQVGIAEQNLIGIAAGLANEGFQPFISSFAPFLTMRAAEQIRMNLGYMEHNVKLVGIGSGLSMGFLGNSHYGLEDIAIIKTIPNIEIVSPCDGLSIAKVLEECSTYKGPVYIRLTGLPNLIGIHQDEEEFSFGKSIQLRIGEKVAIISNGAILSEVLKAADLLSDKNLKVAVYDFFSIRPIDINQIQEIFANYEKVIVVEEHSLNGGLYSTIAEISVQSKSKVALMPISIPEEYGVTGDYYFGLSERGLTYPQIATKISEFAMSSND